MTAPLLRQEGESGQNGENGGAAERSRQKNIVGLPDSKNGGAAEAHLRQKNTDSEQAEEQRPRGATVQQCGQWEDPREQSCVTAGEASGASAQMVWCKPSVPLQPEVQRHLRARQMCAEAATARIQSACPEGADEPSCVAWQGGAQASADRTPAAAAPAADPESVVPREVGGSHLTDEQRTRLHQLIEQNVDCISTHSGDVGSVPDRYKRFFLTIPTEDGATCQQKGYRLSQHENEEFARQIDALLEKGIIGKAEGPTDFVSPVLFVPKPHNPKELRMCVDFRRLNAVSKRDFHSLPDIRELHDKMRGCRYFTTLDLTSGFWALPVAPEDRHKTAFRGPSGEVYVWHRAPMGLTNSPAAFQRFMMHVMHGLARMGVYVDDMCAFHRNFDDHLHTLELAFKRLRAAGLKVKGSKCEWAQPQCKVLGAIVSAEGLRPDPEKMAAVARLPVPRNVADVRSFLGATGYFHAHIPGYAAISEPLRQLLKKGTAWDWTDACHSAFTALKRELTSDRCLRFPDPRKPYILTTDWSKIAVGAMLSQMQAVDPDALDDEHAEQREFAIAFASRAMTPAESHYAATEGECLAAVWAVKKFRPYLHGRRFTLRTDHAALQWLQTAKFDNSKLERWSMRLQEFEFEVEYVRGEENTVADHLSRHFPHLHAANASGISVAGHLAFATAGQALDVDASGRDVSDPAAWQHADLRALWETGAVSDIEAVPCALCGDPRGYSHMVLCDTCERPFHLQCCPAPRTVVPDGSWHCHECREIADCVAELRVDGTPLLFARRRDPFFPAMAREVAAYVYRRARAQGQAAAEAPAFHEGVSAQQRARVRRAARTLLPHPVLPGWYTQVVQLRTGERLRLAVPPTEYRWALVGAYHDRLGHAGVSQTYASMHRHVHWRGMKADVVGVVSACHACQVKHLATEDAAEGSRARMSAPLQHVHIDLAGPFVWKQAGPAKRQPKARKVPAETTKLYVVLVVDYFTKAAEFACIPDKAALTVASAFHDMWLMRYGAPQLLTSDNGLEFAGAFRHLLDRFGIEAIHTAVRHPQSNGAVERVVRTLKEMIAAHVAGSQFDWPKLLPHLRMTYMQRVHSRTRQSPNTLLYATHLSLPPPIGAAHWSATAASARAVVNGPPLLTEADRLAVFLQERDDRHARIVRDVHARILDAQTANISQQTQRVLQRRSRGGRKPLCVGDLAYVAEPSNKGFSATVLGPYVVTSIGDHSVQLRTTGLVPGQPAVTFQRHVGQVARATTHVDVLEELLRDANLLGDDADASSGEPLDPDALLQAHVAANPLPSDPASGL